MKDKDLLKLHLQNGWEIDRVNGSHHIIKKGNRTEVIPVHNKEVPTGLLNKILKRTGVK
jgi:predicted RNA binding protein YcfA (HicA-like mRNA interferase family)